MNVENHIIKMLHDAIEDIRSGNIYEHGYPESRLIPSNFYELCEDAFIDKVVCDIAEETSKILRECIKKNKINWE